MLLNLREEEQELEQERRDVSEELQRADVLADVQKEARLLNLQAVLAAEESAVKQEEQDAQSVSAFATDARRLGELERLEEKLRFAPEENKALALLQEQVALRCHRFLEQVACIIVVKDCNGFANCLLLCGTHLLPLLPLFLLCFQFALNLLDVFFVILHLRFELLNL